MNKGRMNYRMDLLMRLVDIKRTRSGGSTPTEPVVDYVAGSSELDKAIRQVLVLINREMEDSTANIRNE